MSGLVAAVVEAEVSNVGGRTSSGVTMGHSRMDIGQQGAGAGPLGFKPFGGVPLPAAWGSPDSPLYISGRWLHPS